jgi:hypothetical protein
MNNNFNLKQYLTEGKLLNEIEIRIPISTLDEETWGLWVQLADDVGIEDFDLQMNNYHQVKNFFKEMSWVSSNKDKYDDYDELLEAFNNFIDTSFIGD